MAFIIRRRVGLYARIRVPIELTGVLGTHVVRTLKTTDRRIGQTRGALFRARIAVIFQAVKNEKTALILGIPIEEIRESDLIRCDRNRLGAEIETLTDSQRKLLRTRFRFLVERAERNLNEEQQTTDLIQDAVDGLKSAKTLGIIEGLTLAKTDGQTRKTAGKTDKRAGLKLSGLLDSYFTDRDLTPKTEAETRATVRDFEALTKTKPAGEITNEDVARFKSWVQERPGRAGRKQAAHATVQKSLGIVKTVLRWAHAEAGILSEPVGQNVLARKKTRDERAPRRLAFDNGQLKTIFNSPIYSGCLSRLKYKNPGICVFRDDKFYFFLCIFLTGARVEELPGSEITDLDGVTCLDLTKTGTKTQAGARLIPILPELEKTGFTAWARRRIRDGGKLFEGIHASTRWSQWSNRYLDEIGVSDRHHTTYSLRHAFRQILRDSNLNTETVNKIFGHEGETVGENYGRQIITPAEARNFINAVNLPIELKHLCQK